MFKPFFREDRVLNQEPFLDYEVQFNLFHYIIEEKEVTALKTYDNNASAMGAELSSILIKEGLTPMLYADIKNCDSNKVYKSVGFVESGRIDNIIFYYN